MDNIENQENTNNEIENDENIDISFEDLGLDEKSLQAIEKKGFVTPSPIQVLAIPRLLSGEANMIARARTGTGKTAAFGLPIIQRLRGEKGTVKALILEPTRELALQTCAEMQSFTEGEFPRTCVLYGGASYATQIRDLRRGSEIVVGTPGRVQDHLERKTLDISKIDYFILDEGDEMLDMGFIEDIEHIFEQANKNERILLFSATMPDEILKIAQKFLGDYEVVEEGKVIDEPLLIDQKFWIMRENEKIDALVRLIDIADDFYGLVFTQTKSDADFVSRILDEKGYEVAALHGDIAQAQREKILARFRSKKTRVLVATDVAARGIDITGLTHVVNYSLPFDAQTYVHRIGRTGRAGSTGIAVTFVLQRETRKLAFLQRAVRRASKGEMKEETIPSVDEVIEKKRTRIFNELKEKLGLFDIKTKNQNGIENEAETENVEILPKFDETDASNINFADNFQVDEIKAVTNLIESQAENDFFDDATFSKIENKSNLIKVSKEFEKMAIDLCKYDDSLDVLAAVLSVMYADKLDKSRYGKIQNRSQMSSNPNQTRLFVQLGRRDGYNARAIADYFSNLLHIPSKMVDRIDIAQNFSLVSLPKDAAKSALAYAKSNSNIPHMHIDTKDGSFDFDEKPRGHRRGRNFGVRQEKNDGRHFGGRKFGGGSRDFESGRGNRDFSEWERNGRKSERNFKKSSRPNFHTPTERVGSSSYNRQRRERAERF